jgi:hypothetical protein
MGVSKPQKGIHTVIIINELRDNIGIIEPRRGCLARRDGITCAGRRTKYEPKERGFARDDVSNKDDTTSYDDISSVTESRYKYAILRVFRRGLEALFNMAGMDNRGGYRA